MHRISFLADLLSRQSAVDNPVAAPGVKIVSDAGIAGVLQIGDHKTIERVRPARSPAATAFGW